MSEAETTASAEFVEKDFVYAGRRLLTDGKVAGAVFEIDGERLGEAQLFNMRLLKGKAIGGIYRGAKFTGTSAKGLGDASFHGLWPDEGARIGWRSRDEAAEAEQRTDKLEADAKRTHELDELLLPLRKLYAGYAQRNDYAGKEALEAALLRSLRRRPPKSA